MSNRCRTIVTKVYYGTPVTQVSSNTALLKCCEAQYSEAVGIAPVSASAH